MSALTDYFSVLGLPRKLSIDTDALQKRFYEMSWKLHPDNFARAPARERRENLEASSVLNDAYRVLRSPVDRAKYLLALYGIKLSEQRPDEVPAELLEEVFELNMALEELRASREDVNARRQLEQARGRFQEKMAVIEKQLERQFAAWDQDVDRGIEDRSKLEGLRDTLNRHSYVRNLIRDVEKELA